MSSKQGFGRRGVLAGAAAFSAASVMRPGTARAAKAMTVVLESEVVIFDPHFTTAAITRTFGTHVFDTLFAMDGKGAIQPQMVESWTESADKLSWNFKLRAGMKWHDGTPVTAADCVASLNRWMPRDALGRMMRDATASLAADTAGSFTLKLKEPFPLLLDVLGKPNAPLPVMMPERLARTPGDQRITTPIGSGPFRFVPERWKPGSSMILERFADYVPRKEAPDFLAGGKVVKIDELDMRVMPDQTTGATALMAGEIDYMQYLPFDMLPLLEKARGVKLLGLGGIQQFQGNFRLNHATPPFDNPAVRRVLWKLVDQQAILEAIGVPPEFRAPTCASFWMCDAPLSTDAGSAGAKLDIAAAKAELAASGYKGEPVVILEVAGSISQTASQVLVQNMKAAGFVVDALSMDWGTVLARRAKKDTWSMFPVYSNGTDMLTPLTHFYIASTCADFPGWSCDSRIPILMTKFVKTDSAEDRKKIAAEIQTVAYELTPAVMWGQFTIPAGYRSGLANLVQSSYPMFWQVEKPGA
jgi:peptide/nickel transport system substrate-binding protein